MLVLVLSDTTASIPAILHTRAVVLSDTHMSILAIRVRHTLKRGRRGVSERGKEGGRELYLIANFLRVTLLIFIT